MGLVSAVSSLMKQFFELQEWLFFKAKNSFSFFQQSTGFSCKIPKEKFLFEQDKIAFPKVGLAQ